NAAARQDRSDSRAIHHSNPLRKWRAIAIMAFFTPGATGMSHPNAELITRFYQAFQRLDTQAMVSCYAEDVQFSDPVFGPLHGIEVGDMWRMLAQRAQAFSLTFEGVAADDTTGRARWT